MNYKNSTVRKILLGATLFSILTTSLPNSVIAADTDVTNNLEAAYSVDKDENQWEADDFVYDTIFNDELGKNIVLVKGFSEKGLKKSKNITSLIIPKYSASGEIVTGIGVNAFSNTNIVNLNLPDSIEIICDGAFSNSTNNLKIENIKFPKNLKIIGNYSFHGNNISVLELPQNLEKIDNDAFSKNIIREVIFPDSVNEIGVNAFSGNIINSVKLPKNIQKISYGVFSHNRIKDIILPDSVLKIEENAFSNNRIENLTIPKSIKYLSGFSNNNLTSIELPDTLEIIGERAFSGNNIKKLNIPKSVKKIGQDSFSNNNISDLVLSSSLKTIESHSFSSNDLENIKIPNSVNIIDDGAFSSNKISKIKLSDNLKEIGRDAFRNNLLDEIDFPDSIIKIGESAFDRNCFKSFKNFPKNLILSGYNYNNTQYEGYLDQRIKLIAINGNFNLNLEDTEKSYEINDPSITKKSDGTYSLKKDPKFNYSRLFLKVDPYWEIEINNIINFNISYDPNGGVGKISNETIEIDDFYNLKLPENKFTAPHGKKFIGWKPLIEYHNDYNASDNELRQNPNIYSPGYPANHTINGNLRYIKNIKFIAQWEDINKDTNPPRRPDDSRPNIQDVNLNNTKDYIKRLLRNEGILTSFKSNQIDKAQTVDELIYLNNLYLKDKFNNNKNTHTVVEKHYIEKPIYIYNNETSYIDRNVNSHIVSYVPKYFSNDFKKSDEKQIDVKDSKVQKNNNNKYFKFLIGMNLYYKTVDGKDELFEMDVAPFIENDRTMMPLRYVAEALSCDVKWDNKTRTASFTKGGITASIQIDGNEIILSNGEKIKMDSKPIIKNNRLCVSLTNVAKVFNLTNGNTKDKIDQDIEWDQDSKTVTIRLD